MLTAVFFATAALAAPDLTALSTLHVAIAGAAQGWLHRDPPPPTLRVLPAPEARASLAAAGADRLVLFALELDLAAPGPGVTRVRTQTAPAARGPIVLELKADATPITGVDRTAWPASAAVVLHAADALADAVTGPDCAAVPTPQAGDLPAALAPPDAGARTAAQVAEACRHLQGLALRGAPIQLDDATFLAYAGDRLVGLVRGELGLVDGRLALEITPLRPIPGG